MNIIRRSKPEMETRGHMYDNSTAGKGMTLRTAAKKTKEHQAIMTSRRLEVRRTLVPLVAKAESRIAVSRNSRI